jgi:putative acetyltransferase
MNTRVRPERPKDIEAIDNVLKRAFGGTEESTLVRALRASEYFVPPLALVAEEAEEEEGENHHIVGYVLFSRISIETRDGDVPALALAPMAVLPEQQRQGIGTQLVETGLEACRQLGHSIVVLVGHPEYYPRFGFEPARAHGLEAPFAAPDEAFMALELLPGALKTAQGGRVRFSPPFEAGV